MMQSRSEVMPRTHRVPLHDADGFKAMHAAGQLAAATLDMIADEVQPGVTTARLDELCDAFIRDHGALPAPLGYRGYPKPTCISLNHEVCHGIPGERKLMDGDILNIDITVILDGWYGDTSRMFFAGKPSMKARRLCQVTFEALWRGIRAVKPGATLGDIGHAIQTYAESHNYSVVEEYCGHGVGKKFHDAPSVLHFGKPGDGLALEPGMIFTIEPMINAGRKEVKLKKDGWTVVTRDRQMSAQFEHTIGVTRDGVEVFTLSPAGRHHPDW
ncbi:MAG: type I methionyl aminopeptidase [Geminicoccaceae bacterium]